MMNQLFNNDISVPDYLSFFLEYMSADLTIEKDLGTAFQISRKMEQDQISRTGRTWKLNDDSK